MKYFFLALSVLFSITSEAKRVYGTLTGSFSGYGNGAAGIDFSGGAALTYKYFLTGGNINLAFLFGDPIEGNAVTYNAFIAGKLRLDNQSYAYAGPQVGLMNVDPKGDYKGGTAYLPGFQAGMNVFVTRRLLWNLGFSQQWPYALTRTDYNFGKRHIHYFTGFWIRLD